MIVLDASALIAHFEPQDAHHDTVRALLLDAGTEQLAVTAITLAEVLVRPARVGRATEVSETIRSMGVAEFELPLDAAEQLALLRSQTGLRLPDCCVLLAALEAKASVMTFDDRLTKAAADLGLGN